MWEMAVGVGFAGVAAAGFVGVRACRVRRLTLSTTEWLDRLQSQMTSWELANGIRMRDLRQRVTDVEAAVVRAQDEAREAAAALAKISGDVLRRIELVDQQGELDVLAAEGRIPAEHLPAAENARG